MKYFHFFVICRSATEYQFGWSPACFAALRGHAQVMKELLAGRANVNDTVKAHEKRFHIEKGMSLFMICAQFGNNVSWINAYETSEIGEA